MESGTHLVEDLASQVFSSSSRHSSEALDQETWSTFRSTGLDHALASDEPTSVSDAVIVLRAAGREAARIPAAEAILAQWLAARAGWEESSLLPTVITSAQTWKEVPWGRSATAVYFVHDGVIARYAGAFETIRQGANLAGEPRDELARPAAPAEISGVALPAEELLCLGALCKAAMMVGAMDRALELSIEHAAQRVQFGRPIAQFQAVQQMLAQLAAHAAAAGAAVDLATSEFSSFTAAVAKSRASEAASWVTDAAHQVSGAMGFTVEYPLQQLTRRLWAWREESGNELFWNKRIGTLIAGRAQHGLWSLLSDTTLLEQQWQA